ncbi:MAG: hypothetical protein WBA39_26110 [Rivularia sp. (in: cyanobacteria)]
MSNLKYAILGTAALGGFYGASVASRLSTGFFLQFSYRVIYIFTLRFSL